MGGLSARNSWHARNMDTSGPRNKGSWTVTANTKAKMRKERHEAEVKKRERDARTLKGRNLVRGSPSWSQVQRGADKKALKRAQERRDKREQKKALKKAQRKAKGFWG